MSTSIETQRRRLDSGLCSRCGKHKLATVWFCRPCANRLALNQATRRSGRRSTAKVLVAGLLLSAAGCGLTAPTDQPAADPIRGEQGPAGTPGPRGQQGLSGPAGLHGDQSVLSWALIGGDGDIVGSGGPIPIRKVLHLEEGRYRITYDIRWFETQNPVLLVSGFAGDLGETLAVTNIGSAVYDDPSEYLTYDLFVVALYDGGNLISRVDTIISAVLFGDR